MVFHAGFISPTTPAAETNTYGYAAIAGLVGLFSIHATKMLNILQTANVPPTCPLPHEIQHTGHPYTSLFVPTEIVS